MSDRKMFFKNVSKETFDAKIHSGNVVSHDCEVIHNEMASSEVMAQSKRVENDLYTQEQVDVLVEQAVHRSKTQQSAKDDETLEMIKRSFRIHVPDIFDMYRGNVCRTVDDVIRRLLLTRVTESDYHAGLSIACSLTRSKSPHLSAVSHARVKPGGTFIPRDVRKRGGMTVKCDDMSGEDVCADADRQWGGPK